MSAAPNARTSIDDLFPDGSEALAHSHSGALGEALGGALEDDSGPRWQWRGDLGVGGMGRVSLVHDRHLGRDVALKEAASDDDARLLHREASITAALEHPGIVPVYDVGRSLDGRPWYAMRVVRGRSLAAVLAERPPFADRIALLRRLLGAIQAVAFAHARAIVHRDLKPSNLMLGAFGEIQVIDWGLALAPPLLDGRAVPELPALVGTPRTMSPEQARGEPVTAASDVWSLGAILWEVCAGRPAFRGPRDEVLAAVRAGRAPSLLEAEPATPSDLAALIARAMAPSPTDRYPDAAALARDLERWLDGRRVSAYDYGPLAILRRFVRRWRVPLWVAAVAVMVLTAVLAVGLTRISRGETQAHSNLALALASEANRALQVDARGEAEVLAAHALANGATIEARGVLAALSSPRPRRTFIAASPCTPSDVAGDVVLCRDSAQVELWRGGVRRWRRASPGNRAAFFLDRAAAVMVVYRTAYERLDAATGEPLGPVTPSRNDIVTLAADGRSALGHAANQLIRIRGRDSVRITGLHPASSVAAAGLAFDGEHWAALFKDGALLLGRLGDDVITTVTTSIKAPDLEGSAVAFVPGGDDVLVGTTLGNVLRLSTRDGHHERITSSRGVVREIQIAPDGRRAVAKWDALSPMVLDLENHASLGRLPWRGAGVVRWVDDAELMVAADELARWDFSAVTPRALTEPTGVVALAASSDGARLAVVAGTEVQVIDAQTHARMGVARWQDGFVKDAAFVPGTHELVAHGFGDRRLARIDASGALRERFGRHTLWRRVAVLARGGVLAATYKSGVELYRQGDVPTVVSPLTMYDLVASPDGHVAASLGDGQVFVARDLEDGGVLVPCARDPAALAVAPTNEGAVVIARPDAVMIGCHGEESRYDVPRDADLLSLAATATWIAAGDRDGTVWLWQVGAPAPYAVFRDHEGRVPTLAFDPLGKWIAAGDWDGRVAFASLPAERGDQRLAAESAWGLTLELAFARRGTSGVSHR